VTTSGPAIVPYVAAPKRLPSRYEEDEDEEEDRLPRRQSRRRAGFECPFCGSTRVPAVREKISDTGWIVFALLLIFTVCLFWVGFLIKEEYRVCRDCGSRLG